MPPLGDEQYIYIFRVVLNKLIAGKRNMNKNIALITEEYVLKTIQRTISPWIVIPRPESYPIRQRNCSRIGEVLRHWRG